MIKNFIATLFAISMSILSTAAHADNWGIRFDQMPVGTVFVEKDQTGDQWTSTFVGKKGKFYILEEYNHQTARKYRRYYDTKGHHVRTTRNSSQYNYKRKPRSCSRVIGPCSHTVSGSYEFSGRYIYNIKAISATKYVGTWRRVNTEETREFKYTVGKYNLMVHYEYMFNSRIKFIKIISIKEPQG